MNVTHMQTKSLKLIPMTLEDVHAMIEAMSPSEKAELSADWLARLHASTSADPWTHGFSMVHRETGIAIGKCGFKGPPAADGVVEIAYGVDPDHQGKGYATEAAEALVIYAFGDSRVRTVRAHTLPEAERFDTGLDQVWFPLHRRGHRPRRRIGMAMGETARRVS